MNNSLQSAIRLPPPSGGNLQSVIPVYLSLVVPVYNEAENLVPLCQRIQAVLDPTGWTYELILVDDGSSDGSGEILTDLHTQDVRIKVIRFRRNFGQTAALAAGFDYAHGEIIVSLDGDLQNDPADIPRLIAKLNEGYDLVNGWRRNRQDPFLHRAYLHKLPIGLLAGRPA